MKQIVVETIDGETLIGGIVDPETDLYEIISKNYPVASFPKGIWLLRGVDKNANDHQKLRTSFIAQQNILHVREATIFDREVVNA